MLKIERQNLIEHELTVKGSITISECAELLKVSEETIRRDFREMEKDNRLTRIHGGAYKSEADDKNVPIHLREVMFLEEKEKIAQFAVEHFISTNDSIMIDSSTTCFQLAKRIVKSGLNVTIITNSLKIMQLFDEQQTNARLIAIGGKYRNKSCSFVGEYAADALGAYVADKCFVSTSSLDIQHGLIDSSSLECQMHKKILENSKFHYALLDHTKFSSRADYIVAGMTDINTIITDCKPDEKWNALMDEMQIDIYY